MNFSINGSILSKKSESDLFVYLFYYDISIHFMHNLKAYRLQIFSENFLFFIFLVSWQKNSSCHDQKWETSISYNSELPQPLNRRLDLAVNWTLKMLSSIKKILFSLSLLRIARNTFLIEQFCYMILLLTIIKSHYWKLIYTYSKMKFNKIMMQ